MSTPWTEEQNAYFEKLWNEGHAAAKIGNLLGEIGRSITAQTVKDRAHKLGFPRREVDKYSHVNAWSEESRAAISKLWAEGYSATQIACKVAHLREGNVTRNMIIGIVTRMKLPRRAPTPPKFTKPKQKVVLGTSRMTTETASRTQLIQKPKPLKAVPVKPADAKRIGPTLMQLKGHHCRWPVGTKGGSDQMFCGEQSGGGSSYCEEHRKRATGKAIKVSDEERQRRSDRMREFHRRRRAA